MSRKTISLPEELFDELDARRPEDMSWPEFTADVLLPALRGETVSIDGTGDGDLEELETRVEYIEGRLEELPAEVATETSRELSKQFR